jgi:hypothetical protein
MHCTIFQIFGGCSSGAMDVIPQNLFYFDVQITIRYKYCKISTGMFMNNNTSLMHANDFEKFGLSRSDKQISPSISYLLPGTGTSTCTYR